MMFVDKGAYPHLILTLVATFKLTVNLSKKNLKIILYPRYY